MRLQIALVTLFAVFTSVSYAETPKMEPSTPTTRILAIGTVNEGADLASVRAILPTEVRETVKLYLDGKIDQWFSLEDRKGVVFILNGSDLAAASAMLEQLPLGRAHLMHFQLMPIGPLNPLRQLVGTTTASRAAK